MTRAFAAAVLALAVLAASAAAQARFDAASVRATPKTPDTPRNVVVYEPQGVRYAGVTLALVIGDAYAVPLSRIIGPRSRTPEAMWPALGTGYDIVARSADRLTRPALQSMLQTLLAERFRLVAHREVATMPVYELRRRGNAPSERLEEGDGTGPLTINRTADGYLFENSDLVRLASFLSGQVDRPVVDRTELTALYTFTLAAPDDAAAQPSSKREGLSPDSPSAAAYADGLRQLGLQLVQATGPVEYLIVDRVEKPTEN